MKMRRFWSDVVAYFEKEMGETIRGYNAIIMKWKRMIRPRIAAFSAVYDNVQRMNESDNIHVDYATLIWDGLHYQLINPLTTKPVVPYPRYTKLIIDHNLTKHPDIPKRANEPHYTIANDCVKSIFATGNTKARGIGILDVLLNEDIM
ncbi:hypothetical protein Tco_1295627 [Tanacetum coccineum]